MITETAFYYLTGTFLAALAGALLPFLKKWSSRQLHLFLAFGAGVFLGVLFLHIIPEISSLSSPASLNGNIFLLLAFMVLLLIERVLLTQHERECGEKCSHRHEVVGYASMLGLSIHSIAEGVSFGFLLIHPSLVLPLFLAIIAHKWTAAFSLSTVFRLAQFNKLKSSFFLLIFCGLTPLTAVLALKSSHLFSGNSLQIANALAGGTFLYVATCDLLPEAFHESRGRIGSFIAIALGILLMLGLTIIH